MIKISMDPCIPRGYIDYDLIMLNSCLDFYWLLDTMLIIVLIVHSWVLFNHWPE